MIFTLQSGRRTFQLKLDIIAHKCVAKLRYLIVVSSCHLQLINTKSKLYETRDLKERAFCTKQKVDNIYNKHF